MDYKVRAAGKSRKIEINDTVMIGQPIIVTADRQTMPLLIHSLSKEEEINLISVNNKWFSAEVVRSVDGFPKEVILNGVPYPVEIERVESTRYKPQVNRVKKIEGNVYAILPGLIRDIMVETGKHVSKGDTLLVIEAMKMENEIISPIDGWIDSVNVSAGQVVSKGDLLIVVSESN